MPHQPLIITKKHFLDYFQIPSLYWFKTEEEIALINEKIGQSQNHNNPEYDQQQTLTFFQQIFNDHFDNQTNHLLLNHEPSLTEIISQLIDQDDLVKNQNLFWKQFTDQLNQFIQNQFPGMQFTNFHDHQKIFDHEQATAEFWAIFHQKEQWIIFRPKIKLGQFLLNPTYLVKWRGKIYYIEAKLASNQKLVHLMPLIFAEKVLQTNNQLQVNCYLNCLITNFKHQQNTPQFILTAHVPLTQSINLPPELNYDQKRKIHYQLNLVKKSDLNFYCQQLNQKPFHFQTTNDREKENELWTLINHIKAGRPIVAEIEYLKWKDKVNQEVVMKFGGVKNLLNINQLFAKQLSIKDYPITFLSQENLFSYQNNHFYDDFINQKNNDANLKFTIQNWAKINFLLVVLDLNPILVPQKLTTTYKDQKFQIHKRWKWKNFVQAINDHYHHNNDRLTVLDENYWINNYDLNNPLKLSHIWKQLIKTAYPWFDFSGKIANLTKITSLLAKGGNSYHPKPPTLTFHDQKEVKKMLLISPEIFHLYGYQQTIIITDQGKNRMEWYKKVNNRIYYDFESYSLPVNNLVKSTAYAQIVYQVSVIKKINGLEDDHCCNLIFDPLKMKPIVFQQIIDAIYHQQPNTAYVVFNKNFENNRLIEMAQMINQPQYFQKVQTIINNTIDLADFFLTTPNNLQIIVQKLNFYYSIKKIIEIIPQKYLKQSKAISYQQLTRIQNGLVCQSLAINRAMTINNTNKTEAEWNEVSQLMQQYCENDVRSMIAIELWIIDLVTKGQKANKIQSEKLIRELVFGQK